MKMRSRLYVSEARQGLRLQKVRNSFATQLLSYLRLAVLLTPSGHSEARDGSSMM